MCAPVGFIGRAAIQRRVQKYVLSADSQNSAGVSLAQTQNQELINNRSREIQGQINIETMYSILTA